MTFEDKMVLCRPRVSKYKLERVRDENGNRKNCSKSATTKCACGYHKRGENHNEGAHHKRVRK